MIIAEHLKINGVDFIRTYSDAGRTVVRDGIPYDEAYDPAEFDRTYTEGDLIPVEDIELTAQEALDILMGDEPNGETD